MAIPSFDKVYTKACGLSNEIVCPACSGAVSLSLFENHDLSAVTAILGKESKTYFAVCPKCACVFDVNSNYMKERLNGTTCLLTESDLKVMVKGNG